MSVQLTIRKSNKSLSITLIDFWIYAFWQRLNRKIKKLKRSKEQSNWQNSCIFIPGSICNYQCHYSSRLEIQEICQLICSLLLFNFLIFLFKRCQNAYIQKSINAILNDLLLFLIVSCTDIGNYNYLLLWKKKFPTKTEKKGFFVFTPYTMGLIFFFS